MKKAISIILTIIFLILSVSASFEALAAETVSIESFAESVEELNAVEAEEEQPVEESAGSRVILKAARQPAVFGEAVCIKGTAGKYIMQYATEEEAASALDYYNSLSYVKWAELDRVTEMQAVNYGNYMMGSDEAKEYIEEHHLDSSKVVVAVIDTGIDTSSDIYTENARMIDSGVNLSTSGDENSANDDKGHGTNVCAIVLDNTNENVEIVAYKVLNNEGSGSDLAVATAIDLAVENGTDVINLSLGGEGEPTNVLMESIQNAFEHDVTVVVAAGNDGRDVKDFSPACIEECITVSAIDQNGNQDFYSNYGEGVDFAAPGHNIYSNYGTYSELNGSYSGTSFAAPFVSAAAAMVKSVFPEYSRKEIEQCLTDSCVQFDNLHYHDGFHKDIEFFLMAATGTKSCGCLFDFADYLTPENKEIYYGNGMPNLLASITKQRAQSVEFSVDSGHFTDETFTVELSAEEGAEIYYTTDESYPSKNNGTLYTGAIFIDETQSIRAVAYVEGKAPGVPTAREYRTEFHVSEKSFKITVDGSITEYTGTVKELIIPEKIRGITVRKLGYEAEDPGFSPLFNPKRPMKTHVELTSVNLPSTLEESNGIKNDDEIKFITANGTRLVYTASGMYDAFYYYYTNKFNYSNLISITAPNVERIEHSLAGSYLQEAYFPKCTYVCDNAFEGVETLKKVTLAEGAYIGENAFRYCYGLREMNAPKIKIISNEGFAGCRRLKDVDFSGVEYVGASAFAGTRHIGKCVHCPCLKYAGAYAFTNLQILDAPSLEETDYYPYSLENPGLIVSSNFTKCDLTSKFFKGVDLSDPKGDLFSYYYQNVFDEKIDCWQYLRIYGTPNTFAQQFATENDYTFVELPLIYQEPENMGANVEGIITAEIWGFNKEYQWYGTNIKDNRLGTVLQGETEEMIDTSKYDYTYYYCVVKTHDGDYKKDIVTGTRKTLDMNGDSIIDIADLSILLHYYGTAPEKDIYDVNEDGIVDIQDIQYLLFSTVYGTKE